MGVCGCCTPEWGLWGVCNTAGCICVRVTVPHSCCYSDSCRRFAVPGQSVPLCGLCCLQSRQGFIVTISYVRMCPNPCAAPAGCQCARALPLPPYSLGIPHTALWAQRAPATGITETWASLTATVPTGLFPSVCPGCIPLLTLAPKLLPIPWLRPALGVGTGLGFGEPRQA